MSLNFISIAQAKVAQMPNTIEEAKEMGKGFLPIMPGFLKNLWQEAVGVGKWFFEKVFGIWNKYIFPNLDKYFLQKIEKRAPVIKEEFQKEKTEMKGEIKNEVPKTGKSIWQKFKEVID